VIAFAGIGTRALWPYEDKTIFQMSEYLTELGFWCYTGGAPGADEYFERGADIYRCIVYQPWRGFGTAWQANCVVNAGETEEGLASVAKYHPRGRRLKAAVQKLMARNYHQVHGFPEFNQPQVSFVLCCADEDLAGNVIGGTGQACRIAKAANIPIINIRTMPYRELVYEQVLKAHEEGKLDAI